MVIKLACKRCVFTVLFTGGYMKVTI